MERSAVWLVAFAELQTEVLDLASCDQGSDVGAAFCDFTSYAFKTLFPAQTDLRHQLCHFSYNVRTHSYWWRFGLGGNVASRVNKVNRRRARLVQGAAEKSGPLNFFAVFSATVWDFNTKFYSFIYRNLLHLTAK